MSSITFQTPLTPEENNLFREQFRRLDDEELGIVTGEAVKPLFAASGLQAQTLSQVWALVDLNNNGFLSFDEFCAALRVIGHLQQYPSLAVTSDLYAHPSAKLPVLNGSQVGIQRASSQTSAPIPVLAPQSLSKYSQLYDRAANGALTLPGDKAKDIFLKARLPTSTLGEVWALCDKNASGSLDKTEFVMAMHLIQLCMTNSPSVNPLPSTLPSQLWNSIGASVAATVAPLSANSTGRSSLGRRSTISRLSSGVFTSASTDWSLSMEKKQQFDAIFDSLDKARTGSLSSQVLVPFFLSSKLNQDTLASIWDLADIHNNAEFTKLEFAIAMFLIQKKNAGVELPDVVPDQLLHSPALGLYQQQQQPQLAVPSRETKPSFQDQVQPQIPQNSNNGSLNDLMALNSSFASPSPQPPIRHSSSNFGRDTGYAAAPASHSARNVPGQADWSSPNVIREDEEERALQGQYQAQSQPAQQQQMQPQAQSVQYQQAQQTHAPSVPQTVSKSVSPNAAHQISNLSQVPNFASIGLSGASAAAEMVGAVGGSGHRNNDLYADAEASSQLSSATTEMANLSNQVNSLSKQATITNEKKARAAQELKRVNEMKAAIEGKLATLRSTHEQNVKQTETLEAQLAETNKESEGLNQQLAVIEGNYHATESKLRDLTNELQQAQQTNAQLKEQISSLNSNSAALQSQLAERQQHVKQERSLVDVNSRQLEVSQITVANFESEIQGLGEKLSVYLSKRKELDDYQKSVEEQHSQLQTKYQALETGNADLKAREEELENRNKQVEEQEKLYEQHVNRLQSMFVDLSKRKESLDKAEEDLEKQHIEYANKVQDLSERQMKLAMGELPSDSKEIISKNTAPNANREEDVSKFVDDSVANSKLGNATNEDEERTESEVFDKDVPTNGSQTEADDESEAARNINEAERAENLADRFEGDLNEYGIPRSQSLTSSVANNPPQSVMDDTGLPQKLDESAGARTNDRDLATAATQIPGHWEEPATSTAGTAQPTSSPEASSKTEAEPSSNDKAHFVNKNVSQHTSSLVASGTAPNNEHVVPKSNNDANEVLPPIKNLHIDDSISSSSSSEDEFQDTREEAVAGVEKKNGFANTVREDHLSKSNQQQTTASPSAPTAKDEFDDAFTGLEQAADEEGQDLVDDHQNSGSMEAFEKIDHGDLDEELQHNAFTGTLTGDTSAPKGAPHDVSDNVSNDEWDEIFAGFGNAKVPVTNAETGASTDIPVQQPVPLTQDFKSTSSPVNRKIATTPRSLAIEELSGMGFTEQEALGALEKNNWDLEAATNFLLDSA